jgi:hypothetical protein
MNLFIVKLPLKTAIKISGVASQLSMKESPHEYSLLEHRDVQQQPVGTVI